MLDSIRRFEWDDAMPGLRSDEFVVPVTDAAIFDYTDATGDASGETAGTQVAPLGYVFVAAPQRRHALMASVGCHAPEQDTEEPRSTPYVGSNVRFHRAIEPGDTVRSVTVLDRKFERAGNRFVVFRVDATDADGEPIAEYDYTCLWERGSAGTPRSSSQSAPATFQDVRLRTDTVLVKSETAETIAAYGKLYVGRPDDWLSTHTNEEFARTAIFGGAVNAGVATVGYTAQWLDLVERPGILWDGGRFESRALAPVKAGDDLHITGERRESEGDLVYEIVAVNQSGVTTFRSVATIPGA
ncbi:MAG TPA: hypothetical protein EYQ82_01965 [Dehalococcoidia bacterium]|nr:hypothetical protein [Dehalococcoidia bacterium]